MKISHSFFHALILYSLCCPGGSSATTETAISSATASDIGLKQPTESKKRSKTKKHKNSKAESFEVPKPKGIDMDDLRTRLRGNGITGEVHAADSSNRQFVFTYRDPNDFFNNVQIGIVTHNKEARDFFEKMKRHDIVKIRGDFFHEGEFLPESPQPHVEVSKIEMVKAYQPAITAEKKFQKQTLLPDDLKVRNHAEFLVHAILKNGAFMVLEYKDNFVFVVIPDNRFTKDLYRNDRIRMRYKIQSFPEHPTHLELDTDVSDNKQPIEVLDSIHELHGKEFSQEGNLVLFPKSPQINRDIWAIEQKNETAQNSRTFTLVNFSKVGEQEKIDSKLRKWWDKANNGAIIDGRNKLINKDVRIRAKGVMNVVDPNQANAQMKLRSSDIVLLKN